MAQKLVKRVSFKGETAIQELTRGYKLVKQLQSEIEASAHRGNDNRLESATNLSSRVLQTLIVGLSLVKPSSDNLNDLKTKQGVKRSAARDHNQKEPKRGRKEMNSWTTVTPAPNLDGYRWRKYGEKKIHNAKHPRTYYRCSYSNDQGCLATKQVQQQDQDSETPMFLVNYNNQHTCTTTTNLPTPEFILESPGKDESGFWIYDSRNTCSTTPKERSCKRMFSQQSTVCTVLDANPSISSELTSLASTGIAEEASDRAVSSELTSLASTWISEEASMTMPYSPVHVSNAYGFEFDNELQSLLNSFL